MDAIILEAKITGDTLYLPQLRALAGKTVEITVREKSVPVVTPGTSRWADVVAAVEGLEDYDFDAVRSLRDAELGQASPEAS